MSWHVFFDLDRTLWHHERNAEEVLREFCTEFSALKDVDPEEFAASYQRINDDLWDIIQAAGYSVDYVRKRRFPQLLALCAPGLTTKVRRELAQSLEKAFTQRTPDRAHHYEGMIPVLHDLLHQGYVLHVLTNGVLESQSRKIAAMGLQDVFSTHTTSDLAKAYKPDRAIFTYAMRAVGCLPEESVMIGDSVLRDVCGGRQAGMKTIWFCAPDALKPDAEGEADGVFSAYSDLPETLSRIGCPPFSSRS